MYSCRCWCTTKKLSFEWSYLGVIYFLCSENQLVQQAVPQEHIGHNYFSSCHYLYVYFTVHGCNFLELNLERNKEQLELWKSSLREHKQAHIEKR